MCTVHSPGKILVALLLDLDVQETEGVEAAGQVRRDLLVEAVWAPGVCPEGDGDRLPEVVQLEAAAAHGVHDGGVVDNLV